MQGDDGKELLATVEVRATTQGRWVLSFCSNGGKRIRQGDRRQDLPPRDKQRNPDYYDGVKLVFRRLARHQATLEDAYLDSAEDAVQAAPIEHRRLTDVPLQITEKNCGELAARLPRAASEIFSTSATGSPARRITLEFQFPSGFGTDYVALRDRIVYGLSTPLHPQPSQGRPVQETVIAEEGNRLFRLHRVIERKTAIVRAKKTSVYQHTGKLVCEVCDFDFADSYGHLGVRFAECHHRTPLGELTVVTTTFLDDLAIVCANCHRILHRRAAKGMTVEQLREWLRARGKLKVRGADKP